MTLTGYTTKRHPVYTFCTCTYIVRIIYILCTTHKKPWRCAGNVYKKKKTLFDLPCTKGFFQTSCSVRVDGRGGRGHKSRSWVFFYAFVSANGVRGNFYGLRCACAAENCYCCYGSVTVRWTREHCQWKNGEFLPPPPSTHTHAWKKLVFLRPR